MPASPEMKVDEWPKTCEQSLARADVAKRHGPVAEHNAGIDQFQLDYRAAEPEAVAEFCTLVMDSSVYPEEFPHRTRAVYRPDPREAALFSPGGDDVPASRTGKDGPPRRGRLGPHAAAQSRAAVPRAAVPIP